MTSFALDRVRRASLNAYRVDRSLPEIGGDWQPYTCTGSRRLRKASEEQEEVAYKKFQVRGEQINWEGHVTPDRLPAAAKLHPTHRQVLSVLMHRAYSNRMVDIKVSNAELAAIVGRCKRTVAYVLADLAKWGYVGISHVVYEDRKKTWRMIRVHAAAVLVQWTPWESPTWFRTDLRPDTQRYKYKLYRTHFPDRAHKVGLPVFWTISKPLYFSQDGKKYTVDPIVGQGLGGVMGDALRNGWVPHQNWFREAEDIADGVESGETWARQVAGRFRMTLDLNDPQLIR